MRNSIVRVGIICPAPIEYQTCRDLLRLSNEAELAGRLVSSKSDRGIEITAVQAGPGKIQSASATQLIIDRFEPDIIIDTGGAGALSPRVAVFDIVCGEFAYEYDICIVEEFPRLEDDLTTSTVLPDLSEEGKDILHQFVEKVKSERSIGFEIGNIVSGERNVNEKTLRDKLHTAFKALACNWESSAILKTAQLNGVKAMAFLVITDYAGGEMSEELRANWKKALMILFPVLEEFLLGSWLPRILDCLKKET
ncbi:MAG: 5'-methylthioadenosine/S-adenosylhomocysteine nucleosidase [Candidatus Aminicenantaceae bacterium]